MVVCGIDPGTGRTGWGIVRMELVKGKKKLTSVAYGCIETSKDDDMGKRLIHIQKGLRNVFRSFSIDCLAVERLFFGANSTTAMSVGQARGVILLTAATLKLPIFEYQGLTVKQAVTGYGRAKKHEIQEHVQGILGMKERPRPDDAADGLAIAITHFVKVEHLQI